MAVKRVGVIGGGQLASMMAGAADKLGLALVIQTPHPDDPAVAIASDAIFAAVDDAAATAQLANSCEVITFENEFINWEALTLLEERGICFRPSLKVLAPLLDKYQQRCYLQAIGLPVPPFTALKVEQKVEFAFPLVLKARRHGYDGQGTFVINTPAELESVRARFESVPVMIEAYVPFERELAVIAARSVTGEIAIYPVVETYQQEQVCHWVIAPAAITSEIQLECDRIACHLLTELQAVGIFGIELFLTADSKLLVNEIAPRTHNSGHYTLDACEISQFEMHLRAVAGLPLGLTALKTPGAVMVNLLGYEHSQQDYAQKRAEIASIPQTYVHWYGKTQVRPGRKLGHVTVLLEGKDSHSVYESLLQIARQIEAIWYH